MTKKDQGGKRKLEGAIKAIEDFREELEKRGGDTQMVIVPFSDKSTYTECNDDPVENVQLNRFAPPNATQHKQDIRKLQNDLNRELPYIIARENNRKITRPKNSKYRICGETNLYKSLATTISFLRTFNQSTANKNQLNSSPTPNDQQTQPKLHIVLLSDGFNTVPFSDSSDKCDSSHFDELKKYLDPDKITIHTIGYGRDPQALGKDSKYYKYLQGRTPKCEDTLPDRTIKDE
ncbi:MAG: vWA domain-containing protein, partial [Sphaerospermopsis kisseleviana]